MGSDVPEAWADAAEEVRAHLCALRGGAPFLSPMDAWQLVRWLEEGVPVGAILLALERAAEARRRSRSRTPLSLVAAKRHLGRPTAGAFAKERPPRGAEPPFAPVVRARRALAAVRTFLEEAWRALGPSGRAELEDEARTELGDLLALVEEGTGRALVEETARDRLRRRYPALTAATLRELCGE